MNRRNYKAGDQHKTGDLREKRNLQSEQRQRQRNNIEAPIYILAPNGYDISSISAKQVSLYSENTIPPTTIFNDNTKSTDS